MDLFSYDYNNSSLERSCVVNILFLGTSSPQFVYRGGRVS
jgi:hypothetical protein